MNNFAFTKLSYGVYVVSSWDNNRPTGCTANSAMQVTADPATIAVSINHNNYTNKCIERSGKLALSILSEKSEPSIIGTFGFQSGENVNKFDKVPYEEISGLPVVKDACAYLVCHVIDKLETETHTVFLCKVDDADILNDNEPMTYSYYHRVIKGKSPKNAPTYIAEEKPEKKAVKKNSTKWVCSLCGYVYEGEIPFEELPDDWTCPLCGAPKELFEKKEEESSDEVSAEVKEEKTMAKKIKWVCTVCGYVYDGEVPFEELPDDWTCPDCGVPKELFEKVEEEAATEEAAEEPKEEAHTKSDFVKKNDKWVCSVCGYVYDGDVPFEDLPDDWTCPLCGVPKELFEKVEEEAAEEEAAEAPKEETHTKSDFVKKNGKWVCSICGYVYDGEIPFEDLPDDYECPVCGVPKSEFVFEEE